MAYAATIGEEWELRRLAATLPADVRARIDEAVDEAVAASLVESLTLAEPAYAFTHGVVRDAILELESGGDRRRVHREVAAGLESHYGAAADAHAAEIAHHLLAAASAEAESGAYHYLRQAAATALQKQARLEAIPFLEAARRIAAAKGLRDDLGEIARDLATCYAFANADEKREEALQSATSHLRAGGRPRQALELLVADAFVDLALVRPEAFVERGSRAAALAAEGECHADAAELNEMLGYVLLGTGSIEQAKSHIRSAERAAEAAGRAGDMLARVYDVERAVAQATGDWPHARRCGERAVAKNLAYVNAHLLVAANEVGQVSRAAEVGVAIAAAPAAELRADAAAAIARAGSVTTPDAPWWDECLRRARSVLHAPAKSTGLGGC